MIIIIRLARRRRVRLDDQGATAHGNGIESSGTIPYVIVSFDHYRDALCNGKTNNELGRESLHVSAQLLPISNQ